MKRIVFVTGFLLLVAGSFSQSLNQKLQKAYQQFEKDSQLKYAISSLYVIDAKTGAVVFDKNSRIGLAPASTQKIITASTAFELLGKDYRYKTNFYYQKDKKLTDYIVLLKGSGDPTFGSWRYYQTTPSTIFSKLNSAFSKIDISMNIKKLTFAVTDSFEHQAIPDGWIWQDIGNYYGAAAHGFNWRENQVTIKLSSDKDIGGSVQIENYDSLFTSLANVENSLRSGAKGSGDNAYYYFGYSNSFRDVSPIFKGTIPVKEKEFTISIAVADPGGLFDRDIRENEENNNNNYELSASITDIQNRIKLLSSPLDKPFYTHYSPTLDSIIYWFLKKSINLYGEALIKTFAYEKNGFGTTDSGVAIVKDFWKQKGIDEDELNISDGSGLSPQNR
ncbi:MAG: D-alanyl-D-alanine carboxypeptidase/D-alanyl-D-alanine-endopeptidase, partial [Bacteroidota bacterium]